MPLFSARVLMTGRDPAWLVAAEKDPTEPPEEVLLHLADAPRAVFDRVGRWLAHPDPRRRAIAVAAWLRRLYSPEVPLRHLSSLRGDGWYDRFELSGGRSVLAATCAPEVLVQGVQQDPHKFLSGPQNTAALAQVAAAGRPGR